MERRRFSGLIKNKLQAILRSRLTVSLFPILTLGAGLVLGWFVTARFLESGSLGSSVRQSGYKYINPLLECEVGVEFKELASFKSALERKIAEITGSGRASTISVYFRDLNNGPWIGIGEDELFLPASLLKVPLMISYFRLAEEQPEVLKEKLTYEMSYDSSGNPLIKPPITLTEGKSYTVEELIYRMIVSSDNAAAYLLDTNLNADWRARPYRDLGLPNPDEEGGSFALTVRQYASFFRILFNSSYLSQSSSEEALSILAKTEFKSGLVAGVPANLEVAHKFGERVLSEQGNYQLHDCGIIYYSSSPYLLCVMTRGEDLQKLPSVIADISSFVYSEVDRQKSSH